MLLLENEWLKRAGTISIPLPKVSLKLGGESPGPPSKEVSPLTHGERAGPHQHTLRGASFKRCTPVYSRGSG
jgi:hypothetical protein